MRGTSGKNCRYPAEAQTSRCRNCGSDFASFLTPSPPPPPGGGYIATGERAALTPVCDDPTMRISSQLCLTISWLGILVTSQENHSQRSGNSEKPNATSFENVSGDNKTAGERKRRFSIEPGNFDTRIPREFALEIAKLKIPVLEDLPRRVAISEEFSPEEEGEDVSRGGDRDEDREGIGYEDRENDRTEKDDRGNVSDYDEYDSPPKNSIPYEYEDSGEKPVFGKPTKRPHVDYEVSERIPHDTKTVRPPQQVYPLPPPCPGAPPPTYPTPPPKAPPPPTFPPHTFPIFPKRFPNSPKLFPHSKIVYPDDVPDSYYPTSFMSSTSFTKDSFRRQAATQPPLRRNPKRNAQDGNSSPTIARVSRPRYVLSYRQQPAFVIRKIQHVPVADRRVIIRTAAPPVKEVHIHHHHDSPQVVHIHGDDEAGALDTAKFKAGVEGQRLISQSQFESATSGPFAEPPTDFRLSDGSQPSPLPS